MYSKHCNRFQRLPLVNPNSYIALIKPPFFSDVIFPVGPVFVITVNAMLQLTFSLALLPFTKDFWERLVQNWDCFVVFKCHSALGAFSFPGNNQFNLRAKWSIMNIHDSWCNSRCIPLNCIIGTKFISESEESLHVALT